jgi:oligopeptide transport system substrate-binding protein
VLALSLLVLLLAASCSPGEEEAGAAATPEPTPTEAAPVTPGVLYAFARQPSAIIPPTAVDADDLIIVDQLFDGLTAVDADLEVVPAAAHDWEVSEDATVHTFHLRTDATFHDGTPVTAESFIRSWERIADRGADPPSPAHHLLDVVEGIDEARDGGPLSGVEAVDDHTLEVRLRAPFAEFPEVVSHPSLGPLPEAAEHATDFDRTPIGNGPFRMVEPWQPGQFVRLEPFGDHPEANPAIEQLVFRIYEGDTAVDDAYGDFQVGRLHVAPVPDADLREVVSTWGTAVAGTGPGVVRGPRLMTVYYAFNVEVAPFDDPAVRRAIALSVDARAVLAATDPDTRVAATSLIPGVLPGYEPPVCDTCRRDVDRARALLEEAEVALDPIVLTVHDGAEHVDAAEQVRRDIEAALGEGTVEVDARPTGEWLEAVRTGEAGFFLSGWIPEYPSPGAYLDALFNPDHHGTDNLTRYADEEVGDWLEEARATIDRDERYAFYARVEERVLADAAVIPLYHYRHARVVSDRTAGIVIDPAGRIDFTVASVVEVD